MASFNYDPLKALATKLLDKYGAKGCRLVRPTSGVADADKPWRPANVSTPDTLLAENVVVVRGDYKRMRGQVSNAPFALTIADTNKAFCSADITSIEPGDYLEIPQGAGYERFSISAADKIIPGATLVLWDLTLGS